MNVTLINFDVFKNGYCLHSSAEDYVRFIYSCKLTELEYKLNLQDVIQGFKQGYGETISIMNDEELEIITEFWDSIYEKNIKKKLS